MNNLDCLIVLLLCTAAQGTCPCARILKQETSTSTTCIRKMLQLQLLISIQQTTSRMHVSPPQPLQLLLSTSSLVPGTWYRYLTRVRTNSGWWLVALVHIPVVDVLVTPEHSGGSMAYIHDTRRLINTSTWYQCYRSCTIKYQYRCVPGIINSWCRDRLQPSAVVWSAPNGQLQLVTTPVQEYRTALYIRVLYGNKKTSNKKGRLRVAGVVILSFVWNTPVLSWDQFSCPLPGTW